MSIWKANKKSGLDNYKHRLKTFTHNKLLYIRKMKTDLILDTISKYITFTEEEIPFFLSLLREKKIRKKQFLYQEGDICKYTTFVNKGCLRTYAIDNNGTEHVFQFATEGWWIGDIESLKNQTPTMMNTDALEDSEILLISKTDMDLLYEKIPKYEHFSRMILENAYIAHQQRILHNVCFSATERYQYFIEKYPEWNLRIPQNQIASYLGITPEFFSKMKSQFLREK
ncbi:MAG TPA: Crp/Fnr family transcriptional regulator [Hanamia sp.]|nr:Crp/Fnr family transcriptional regulator [Hanamia sp.]